ncbi:MAG: dTDP-4-dehydrorhamnose 3,5-epimerase family protein, partial [Acidobacteriota bacterium]|nr:dTDP-4-dehydrorhamnose 3,5-epimerase family protein [Acidobacteriota bacterium]
MSALPTVRATGLPSVLIVEPVVHRDGRGFFLESYNAATFAEGGIGRPWVQDNHSRSNRDTVRGLHLQCRRQQTKLVRVTRGEVFDVAVDVRRGSPSFLEWTGCL